MVVVRIEMWPKGNEAAKRTLAVGRIINDDTGTLDVGNYRVELLKTGSETAVWRAGEVKGFPRRSGKLGVWDLLFRGLRAAVGSRNT